MGMPAVTVACIWVSGETGKGALDNDRQKQRWSRRGLDHTIVREKRIHTYGDAVT